MGCFCASIIAAYGVPAPNFGRVRGRAALALKYAGDLETLRIRCVTGVAVVRTCLELLPARDHQVANQRHEALTCLSAIIVGLLIKLAHPGGAEQITFAFFHQSMFF